MNNLRVNPLRSIGAKLFYLTTLLVVGTVGAISWKNAEAFREQLSRQFQRSAIDGSENAGNAIESLLTNWESQLKLVLQNVANEDPTKIAPHLDRFLNTDDNFIAVQIFKVNGNNAPEQLAFQMASRDNAGFENESPKKIADYIAKNTPIWLASSTKEAPLKTTMVRSLYRDIKVPLMSVARGFKVKGSDLRYWAVLTAWQKPLLVPLKSSKVMMSVVIDQDGKVFAAKDVELMKASKNFKQLEIVKMARDGVVRSGFRGGYFDDAGRWLGAYYRVSRYDLVVIVQQDAASAYAAIRSMVLQTFKWGAFFVLLAVFFSYFGSNGMTHSMRALTTATQKIAAGDFGSFVTPRSKDEVGQLSLSVNIMARRIQDLLQAQVAKARFEKELETAHAVQDTLFPKKNRKKKGVMNVAGYSTPATECGGDWWGHYVSDDGVEYIFVADAMGHGVPAALVTAMAYSSCMSMISFMEQAEMSERSPKTIVERFNKVLYDAVEGSISMTFFALALDYKTGRLSYANAGHNFPILIPAHPDDDRVGKKTKSLQKISPLTPVSLNKGSGSILGVEREAVYEEHEMALRPGDRFVLFTDGLIECTSPGGEAWGRKVLLEKILAHGDKDADALKDGLVQDALDHFDKHPLNDDVTVVTVDFPKDVVAPIVDLNDDSAA